ncbi:MAG: GtrA family protein, partial [Nitrospirales bacterium]|nr:GtrA family protein [Nitrospirales bacterium]
MRTRFQEKKFRFVLAGGVAALFNLLLMSALVEFFGFDTAILRNVANALSIELSLIASFFFYRLWVWPGGSWDISEMVWEQLPLYHMSSGVAVFSRIFLVFPFLDWLAVHYALNTLAGVAVGATINYVLKDHLLFQTPVLRLEDRTGGAISAEIHYPEGLGPALICRSSSQNFQLRKSGEPQDRSSGKLKVLSVLIPAHNEADGIVHTIQSVSQTLEKEGIAYEILVINDHSTDQTEERLQNLLALNTKIFYKNNYYPMGFGFAVRCG